MNATLVVSPHKLWVALFVISFFSGLARATSIVVLVTQDRIIIASDGVVTAVTNGVESFPKFCKIRTDGNVYYAIAGDYGAPQTELDVWKITSESVAKSPNIIGILDSTEAAILNQLKAIAERNRLGDPKTYARWISGDPVTEMLFAGIEGGPIAAGLTFYVDGNGDPVRPARRDVIRPEQGTIGGGRIGQHQEIEAILPLGSWQKSFIVDPIDASRYLIQREIDAGTREERYDVGPPIAIATITASSAGFVKGYEGACPNN
jgi:hypothetical protein